MQKGGAAAEDRESPVRVTIVVAVAENGVIGRDNALPWHLPEDLRRFKTLTWGKPVIMGRLTHESIGRPLPGRRNIVLSRDAGYTARGCETAQSLDDALGGLSGEVMVIGGAGVYREALPRAERIEMTRVHRSFDGDTKFPELDRAEWREAECIRHPPSDGRNYAISFVRLERSGTAATVR